MRSRIAILAALCLGAAAPVLGCGSDDMERGLAPANEEAVPASPAEERMTEEQRRQQEVGEDEAAEARDFDAATGSGEEGD